MKFQTFKITTVVLLGFVLTLGSCMDCLKGKGDPIEESRALGEFDVLVQSGSMDVVIHQRPGEHKVVVTAQENLMHLFKTEVKGKKLVIESEGCFSTSEKLRVDVYVANLARIIHDGSGDLSTDGKFKFTDLKIITDGSGDVELQLSGNELEIIHGGSGDIDLRGQAESLELEQDGSGELNAFEFRVNEAEIETDGSGDVSVYVKGSLEVNSDGSGDVNIKGNPQNLQTNKSGSGSLKHVD